MKEKGEGVLCHEMYHTLGVPDLYPYNQDEFTPVGPWDVIEHIYGQWIEELREIIESGYYTLNSLENSEKCWTPFYERF